MITYRLMTTESITSKLIRQVTWSPYSHVDIVVPEGLLGAKPDGVKIRTYDEEQASRFEYLGCDLFTPAEEQAIYNFYYAQIGKPYDFGALAGFLTHEDWRNPNKWFCSELAFAGPSYIGKPLLREEELDRVSPGLFMLSPFLKTVVPPKRNIPYENAYHLTSDCPKGCGAR